MDKVVQPFFLQTVTFVRIDLTAEPILLLF